MSQEPTARFREVQHPVTAFLPMPGVTVLHAVRKQVETVITPFTLILGPQPFIGQMDIEFLIEELADGGEQAISAYYRDDHSAIAFRSSAEDSEVGKDHLYNELFHSSELKRLMRHIPGHNTDFIE